MYITSKKKKFKNYILKFKKNKKNIIFPIITNQ